MSQTIAYVLDVGLSRRRRSLVKPPPLREIYYGFVLRVFVGLASAIVPLCVVGIMGFFNGWRLTTPMLVGFAATVFATILFGEHVRSRAYERTAPTARHSAEPDNELEPIASAAISPSSLSAVASHDPASMPFQRGLKRVFDILIAVALIIVLMPAMIIIALLIKLDSPGPVLVRFRRVGLHGRTFASFRFRTAMVSDSAETRIGRWLRRSSQDELPGIWSVLIGNMSFVGPRPLSVKQAEELRRQHPDEAVRLLRVRPGFIGVRPHKTQQTDQAIRLETRYLDNWSFRLDLTILIKSIRALLRRKTL